MFRIFPALLVSLLACTGPAWADDAKNSAPPLESRVGCTVTVVEANRPAEKATIVQVWRLDDGSPVMQAKSLASGLKLTMVENLTAKSAADRIKVYRWTAQGTAPAGCPNAPIIVQTSMQTPIQTVVKTAASDKVAVTDGGLLPALPKKEEPKTVLATPPAPLAQTVQKPMTNAMPLAQPAKTELKTPAPTMLTSTSAAPVQAAPMPVVVKQNPVVQARPAMVAPAVPVMAVPAQRELVDGCEVVSVTENGKTRKYKVIGSARDKDGIMTQRCQALDNSEIITLNCANCCVPKAACASPVCAPAAVACPPVKCEVTKPVCPPVVACAPVKKCESAPCVTKACEPCKEVCVKEQHHKCHVCGDTPGGCDACNGKHSHHAHVAKEHASLSSMSCKFDHWHGKWCNISVPVPGVHLASVDGMPGGPPPQPMIPAFCTMNSCSIRAALCAPQCAPMGCLYQPFSACMNAQIQDGICQAHGAAEGEAIKNSLYLVNVLNSSKEWENRAWAAQRLEAASLPQVKPYVEDVLMAAIQNERAPQVRMAAMRTVAHLNPNRPDVQAMLAQAAMDSDPRIREAALDMLGKINTVQQAGYAK
jgi:hypothetical protein